MTPKTKTELCQIALGKIGISKRLTDVATDQTNEAIQLRLYYDGALDRALGELPWRFATKTATLTDLGTPPDNWGYRYAIPADCVAVRKVPYAGMPTSFEGAPFAIVENEADDGLALCTDVADATLIYTFRVTTIALYPQTFIDLFTWSLAMDIAPVLSTVPALVTAASQGYAATSLRVAARDLNQDKTPAPTESDFITARY